MTDTLAGFWDKSTSDLLREAARADGDAETPIFKRSLSALQLVTLGIGGIIGAGIFVLTGHAAAANAGPAVTLSFMADVGGLGNPTTFGSTVKGRLNPRSAMEISPSRVACMRTTWGGYG